MAKTTTINGRPSRLVPFEQDPTTAELLLRLSARRTEAEKLEAQARAKRSEARVIREEIESPPPAPPEGASVEERVDFIERQTEQIRAELDAMNRTAEGLWQAAGEKRAAQGRLQGALMEHREAWGRRVVEENRDRLQAALVAEAKALAAYRDALASRVAVSAELNEAGVYGTLLTWGASSTPGAETVKLESLVQIARNHCDRETVNTIRALV